MVKVIALMKIRKDITASEARRKYEEEHAPLVMELMPMVQDYRRNYLDSSTAHIPASETWPDFDIITELLFNSVSDFEAFQFRMREGEEGRLLRADSSRFLIAGSTRMFTVDETILTRDSDFAGNGPN